MRGEPVEEGRDITAVGANRGQCQIINGQRLAELFDVGIFLPGVVGKNQYFTQGYPPR